MDIIKKFNELVNNLYTHTDHIYNNEMETIKEFLKVNEVYSKSNSHIQNSNDSIILSTYEFKNNVMDILINLIEIGFRTFDDELISVIGDLVIAKIPSLCPDSVLQIEEIMKNIQKKAFRIFYYSADINKLHNVRTFLMNEDMPDFRNICLSVLFNVKTWKSYDLECIGTFSSPSIIYDVVKLYKEEFVPEIKFKIVDTLSLKIKKGCDDLKFIYLIFYECNTKCFESLICSPVDGEFSDEFLMFLHSLIVNHKTAYLVYNLLNKNEIFDELKSGLDELITLNQSEKRPLEPCDEQFLFHIIENIDKILFFKSSIMDFIKLYFMRFIDPLMKYLMGHVGKKTKGAIFAFLNNYMADEENRVSIIEFFKNSNYFTKSSLVQEFEEELAVNNFYLTPKILKFAYYINPRLSIDFGLYCLRSEDVATTKIAFELFYNVDYDLTQSISLSSKHIRIAMMKSKDLTNFITLYQIEKEVLLQDVSLISVILNTEGTHFFSYVRMFKDFSMFLSDKFLDRLLEMKEEGLEYLVEATKTNGNVCKFVKNNVNWFNIFFENNPNLYSLIYKIYENVLDYDIEDTEMSLKDGFLLKEYPDSSFFNILAKKIGFQYMMNNKLEDKYITNLEYQLDEDALRSYCLYLKCRCIMEDDIENQIKYLVSKYEDLEDILGYYKIVRGVNLEEEGRSVISNYDKKNTDLFISLYNKSTSLEKFLLFFTIQRNTSHSQSVEVLKIIKDEVTRIMLLNTRKIEDNMILRQCLYTCLIFENIDSIARLVKDIEDTDLLLKLNIRNICTGGTYFNKSLVKKGDLNLQIDAVFILYYNNIWNHLALKDWILYLYKECRDNDNINYLVNDISKNHEFGFELQMLR